MPTIVLRHIVKSFGPMPEAEQNTLGRMINTGTRTLDAQDLNQREPVNRRNAINELSMTLRDGETLSVLGPSGCGKTTLLKIIAGLVKPDEGDVLYDGVPIDEIPMAERGIGMVFQSYALYPHLRARENIGFYDLIRNQPERIPERIHHIVGVMGVELRHLLSRKPPTLSGGEQQRVAMARCLAREPQVFLFDEPLSHLDAKLRIETRVQLKRLLQHYRITSVYVTHDQVEAIALANRIAIMRDGAIEQIGTYQSLYDAPRNAFVAQFFGTPPMNLFAGYVWNDTWEGRSFEITPIRPGLRQGQGIWVGIRPEHVELDDEGIPAQVDMIEPVLPQRRQLVYMEIQRQRFVASLDLNVTVKPRDILRVRFPAEHLYLFDKETEARIG